MSLTGPRLLCLIVVLLYVAFLFWYGGRGKPMTPQEVESYFQRIDEKAQAANVPLDAKLIAELRRLMTSDDGNEFFMLNLINYHEQAQYPPGSPFSGTGLEADERYSRAILPLLLENGAHPIFLGEPQGRFIDEAGDTQWQRVAIVRYRSRRDLMEMIVGLVGLPIGVHKWASISKTQVFPMRSMFSLGSARGPVGLVLGLLGLLSHLLLRGRQFYRGGKA